MKFHRPTLILKIYSLDLKYEKLSNAETERRLTDENEELAKTKMIIEKIADDKRKKNKENIANGEFKVSFFFRLLVEINPCHNH